MGRLSERGQLLWWELQKHAGHIRRHGLLQFLAQYRKLQANSNNGFPFKWGDETEYMVVKFDHAKQKVYVSPRSSEILAALKPQQSTDIISSSQLPPAMWHKEYASYSIEGIPGEPYGGTLADLISVQDSMNVRRRLAEQVLSHDEALLSMTVFPRLGCQNFTWPSEGKSPNTDVSGSLSFPDVAISEDTRYRSATKIIRERRRKKVAINVPVFKDVNVPHPFREGVSPFNDDVQGRSREAKPDHIYGDATGLGTGVCCLQVTFQATDLQEAETLHDQLAPLCPIMLALTAASPIFKGYLTDVDTRWLALSQSSDDRTDEETGIAPLKNEHLGMLRPRFDSIDSYLSLMAQCCNDVHSICDTNIFYELRNEGLEDGLALHLAQLFVRDPIYFNCENLDLDDEQRIDHFETFQSTNWKTLRLKLPPPTSNIGWRVEFRPMEVQLTEFENAAFAVFMALMTRVILTYKLNFVIPISKVDENMRTSSKRGAVLNEKFYFQKNDFSVKHSKCDMDCELMTMDEIFHGKDEFPGLIPLARSYLDDMEGDVETHQRVSEYLKLISLRASGELSTCAHWIRQFVVTHPDYKQDSVVSDSIAYDLLKRMSDISSSRTHEPSLLYSPSTHRMASVRQRTE